MSDAAMKDRMSVPIRAKSAALVSAETFTAGAYGRLQRLCALAEPATASKAPARIKYLIMIALHLCAQPTEPDRADRSLAEIQ